jgi:hypothetical protein
MYSKVWIGLISSGLLILGVACGGGGGGAGGGGEQEAVEQAPAAEAPAGGTGSIKGAVTLSGQPPTLKKINMGAEQHCKMQHADNPPVEQKVVTNPDGTLRNVFVYVKDGLAGKKFPTPTDEVKIDQSGCMYEPHVLGIMVGQPLKITNSDPLLHNIHSLSKNSPQFNIGMPTKGMDLPPRKFTAEEVMVRIKCDVHPWMEAFVGVLNHPFYSVTGDGGTFELKDVPEGTYTIEAWHETYGTQTQSVTVKPGEPMQVNFAFQAAS